MTTLGKLLAAKEPLFDHALDQLEKRTGRKGADTKLAAELAEKSANRMKQLGLRADCSGQELYQALIDQVKLHDEHLARAIGGQDPASIPEMIPLIVAAIERADLPRQAFALKPQVIAHTLRQMPPLGIMQRLGYDSVDRLLASEDIFEVALALRFAESAEWLNKYNLLYKHLKRHDFETRPIRVIIFDPAKWGDIAEPFIQKKLHNITHSKEMAAIGVMPMTIQRMPGVTLKVMPLLAHYFNEVRLYSAFFKLNRTKRNFGQIIAKTLIADTPKVGSVKGQHIHWRVIQRYFGKLKHENHPEIFEPHVQPEDLHWRKAEEVLYAIDPELEFWRELDYVAVLRGDEIITFNLMDVSLSYSNQLAYPDRYIYHFREALWNEIFERYLGEKVLEEQLLVNLNNNMIKPEELTLET
jgi:hypothetical protein